MKKRLPLELNLQEQDERLQEKLTTFRKTAVVEGAGTGAGGILLGLADFPLLLSIKMKFLFEAAAIYGFDTDEYEERLYILHIFLLAFSSEEKRKETLRNNGELGTTKGFNWGDGLARLPAGISGLY